MEREESVFVLYLYKSWRAGRKTSVWEAPRFMGRSLNSSVYFSVFFFPLIFLYSGFFLLGNVIIIIIIIFLVTNSQ